MAKVIRFVGVVASFLSEFLPLLLSTSLLLFVAWLCVFRFFGFCFVFSVYGQLSSPAKSLEPSSHAQFSTHTTQRKSTELNNGHLSKVRHFCCRRCVCIVARRVYAAYESYYAYATLSTAFWTISYLSLNVAASCLQILWNMVSHLETVRKFIDHNGESLYFTNEFKYSSHTYTFLSTRRSTLVWKYLRSYSHLHTRSTKWHLGHTRRKCLKIRCGLGLWFGFHRLITHAQLCLWSNILFLHRCPLIILVSDTRK